MSAVNDLFEMFLIKKAYTKSIVTMQSVVATGLFKFNSICLNPYFTFGLCVDI